MPRLLKDVLPAGEFLVSSNVGRIKRSFDRGYLERIAQSANAMISHGLKIPAPFGHSKAAKPATEIEINTNKDVSPYHNGGYWEAFVVMEDENHRPVLKGYVDCPGSKDDTNSPYYKALNTAKEVSISVNDEFTDGLGRKWKDALLHVALVNNAVVPGQKDFEEVPDGSTIINMSMLETGEDDGSTLLSQLRSVLKEAVQIEVPEAGTTMQFLRDLLVAAMQIKANRPNGQTLEPVPIYMSIGGDNVLTEIQAKGIVDAKTINPATSKPYTMEDLGFKSVTQTNNVELSALQAQLADKESKLAKATNLIQAFANKLKTDAEGAVKRRIETLIEKGTITKEWAEANLGPKLGFQMSVNAEGQFDPHPLETTLSALEAVAASTAPTTEQKTTNFFDGVVQPNHSAVVEMSIKEQNESYDDLLQFLP